MKILSLTLLLFISIASPAQILNKIKNKIKGKAESEVRDAKYEAKVKARDAARNEMEEAIIPVYLADREKVDLVPSFYD